MGQWKGDSLSEEEYNFQNFEKNKGQTGGPLSNFPMEEPKATSAMVTEAPAVKEEKSQAEQLVDWLRSPITQAAGVATAATVGTGMAVKGLLGRGKNVPEEKPRVEPTFTEPPPFAPQKTAQPDVTDVASRPVGQARPQLGGPTTAPTQAPVAPPTAPAPSAPMAPAPSAPMPPAGVVGGAPAPANVAPTPVAPAAPPPVDPIMQAKLDAIADKNRRENEAHAAQQRRLDEIHQTKLANEAKRAEAKVQAGQGKAASPTSVDEQAQALLKKSDKNTIANAVAQASAPKPIAPPPVAPAAQAAAVMPPPNAPITSATPATAPTNPPKPVIETTGLTKEEAGMKKYLTSFYGGGTEGEKAYGKTIEILGKTPAFEQGKGG